MKKTFLIYKNYKSTLQKIKWHSKRQYFSDKCSQFKNDTKKLWKTINNAIKSSNDKSNLIDSIKVDTVEITDAQQIAEEFGKVLKVETAIKIFVTTWKKSWLIITAYS